MMYDFNFRQTLVYRPATCIAHFFRRDTYVLACKARKKNSIFAIVFFFLSTHRSFPPLFPPKIYSQRGFLPFRRCLARAVSAACGGKGGHERIFSIGGKEKTVELIFQKSFYLKVEKKIKEIKRAGMRYVSRPSRRVVFFCTLLVAKKTPFLLLLLVSYGLQDRPCEQICRHFYLSAATSLRCIFGVLPPLHTFRHDHRKHGLPNTVFSQSDFL